MYSALQIKRPPMMTTVEEITPEKASEWLQTCQLDEQVASNYKQRMLRMRKVNQIAMSIINGKYELNGESIKFSTEGRLIDGQHRLQAVVNAGIPITSVVCRNVPPDAISTIDTGTPRSPHDVLYMRGEREPHLLAAIIRVFVAIERRLPMVDITRSELLSVLTEHPGLREAPTIGRRCNEKFRHSVPGSEAGALWYVFSRISSKDANAFFDILVTGDFPDHSPGVASIKVLRERIFNDMVAKRKLSHLELRVMFIKTWNAYRNNERIQVLRFSERGRNAEEIPVAK